MPPRDSGRVFLVNLEAICALVRLLVPRKSPHTEKMAPACVLSTVGSARAIVQEAQNDTDMTVFFGGLERTLHLA